MVQEADQDQDYSLLFEKEIEIIVEGENEEKENSENEEEEDIVQTSQLHIQVSIKQTDDNLEGVRIRFFSQEDIRFLYERIFHEDEFNQFKTDQELDIDFGDFPNVLEEVLSNVSRESEEGSYKAILRTEGDDVVLCLQQDLELCTTDIFTFKLPFCKPERIEQVSQQRYDELIKQYNEVATQYKDMIKRIKRQDPKVLAGFKPLEDVSN